MEKYNQTFVPTIIGLDLMGHEFNCKHCKFKNVIGGTHPTHTSLYAYENEERKEE